mmetsp:Transcript_3766/g.5131  ORF Transcript_3766/g.5131 Transcript_3766/m.5131 type:complete len:384 (+) Transcript_3766:6692-7843(+)
MTCIRRANLDSFWAREEATVINNKREAVRYTTTCSVLGMEDPYPPRGPYPEVDTFGMLPACAIFIRSLDPGINASNVQFSTICKLRSHVSNYVHTTALGVGPTFIGEEGRTQMVSSSPTNSLWFQRFMTGCHKRMGDVLIPDRAIPIEEILASIRIQKERLESTESDDRTTQLKIILTTTFIISGFISALRGEEMVKIDLGGIRFYWNEGIHHPSVPHVPLIILGKSKGEKSHKMFVQPLAITTQSGIEVRYWFHKAIVTYEQLGVTTVPMFRKDLGIENARAGIGDLDVYLHDLLKQVQDKQPEVLPSQVNVEEEYSCQRSLRRGATLHAQNVGIKKEVIEANNKWRKHARANGMLPGMSTMERYSDAKASVPTLIRFSKQM